MSDGGWLPQQHLMPDAVVAFVDNEISSVARERVLKHLAHCTMCARDTSVQRQARAAMRTAEAPTAPAGLLAALRSIPIDTDLPDGPDQLAVTEDGQLVAVQRTRREREHRSRGQRAASAALGSSPMLGSSAPLGSGPTVLSTGLAAGATAPESNRSWGGRRAVQGASVLAAGLMLGALAMVGPHILGNTADSGNDPAHGDGSVSGGSGGVQQANFATPFGGDVRAPDDEAVSVTSATPTTTRPVTTSNR